MSPTLFNVFMDVLAECIEPSNEGAENSGIILFADDVQLTAKTRLALEQNLDTAFTWATETEMTSNVRKRSTLLPEHDQEPLRMGTELIQTVELENYLVVTITRQGITDKLLRERVQKARERLEMLKRLGLNAKAFEPKLSRNMYLTFIRAMFEYCCHLVRIKQETIQEVLRLERAFFKTATGIYKAPRPWLCKPFKLEDFKARIIRLRDKMRNHTSECDRLDNAVLETALTLENNTEPSRYTETT